VGRIVFSLVVLVVIATLIVLNAGSVAPFNLFGHTFAEVPVIVIAICGFVVGVLYSFVYYLMRAVAKMRRARLLGKADRLQQRAEQAEASAQQAEEAARQAETAARQAGRRGSPSGAAASADGATGTELAPPSRRSFFSRLFGGSDGKTDR